MPKAVKAAADEVKSFSGGLGGLKFDEPKAAPAGPPSPPGSPQRDDKGRSHPSEETAPSPEPINRWKEAIERARIASLRAREEAAKMGATLNNVFGEVPRELSVINQRAAALGPSFDAAKARVDALGRAIHQATAAGATMADPRLAQLSRDYAVAGRELEAASKRAASGGRLAGAVFGHLRGVLMGIGAAAAAVLSVSAVAGAVRNYADLEGTLNSLKAVSNATRTEFEAMRERTLQLSTSTAYSANEAAQGMTELARAGFKAGQVMKAIGGTMALAAAGEIDIARASEVTTDTLNQFGLAADQAGRVADVMASAANASSIGVNQIAESMTYAGSVSKAYGQSLEDVSSAIAVLGNAGIKGSTAGTALAAFMNRLAAPSKDAAGFIKQLGLQVKDAHGGMRPLPDLIDQVRKATQNVGKVERGRILKEVFGEEALKGVVSLIETMPAKYKETSDAIHNSAGEAERLAKIMNSGLRPAWNRLNNVIESFATRIMIQVAPTLADFINRLADGIQVAGDWARGLLSAIQVTDKIRERLGWLRLALALLAPGFAVAALRTWGGVILATVIPAIKGAAAAAWGAARAFGAWLLAAAPIIIASAAITGLILVLQDLYTWLYGGETAPGAFFDSMYSQGYDLWGFIQSLGDLWEAEWNSVVATVIMHGRRLVSNLDATLSEWSSALEMALRGIPGMFSTAFKSAKAFAVSAIDSIIASVRTLPTALVTALAALPGVGAAIAKITAAAAPLPTPGQAADSLAKQRGPLAPTINNSISVTTPPGATSPAAYGSTAAAGAGAGTKKALNRAASMVPRPMR